MLLEDSSNHDFISFSSPEGSKNTRHLYLSLVIYQPIGDVIGSKNISMTSVETQLQEFILCKRIFSLYLKLGPLLDSENGHENDKKRLFAERIRNIRFWRTSLLGS